MISEAPPDEYQSRIGVAYALKKISPIIPDDQLYTVFTFFVQNGLGDRHSEVRLNNRQYDLFSIRIYHHGPGHSIQIV